MNNRNIAQERFYEYIWNIEDLNTEFIEHMAESDLRYSSYYGSRNFDPDISGYVAEYEDWVHEYIYLKI